MRTANRTAYMIQLLSTELGNDLPDAWCGNFSCPVVSESWKHTLRCDCAGFELDQPRIWPKSLKGIETRNFRVRWQYRLDADAAYGNMNILVREAASLDIPSVCSNPAAGPNHAPRFHDSFDRIGNEENAKRHNSHVEGLGWI
jgi:hypothetical protein